MASKTIVVLGGGVGGLVATNELRRLVHPEHRIVLIEKSRQQVIAPSSRL
jgi:NADH dehydrogenase FAD-containing subunit